MTDTMDTTNVNITTLSDLTEYIKSQDNSAKAIYFSPIPEICKTEPCILGVDEAGRGPVLGPMVYGITFCPESKMTQLEELQCADSKTLTEEKRNGILEKIMENSDAFGWAVDIISPNVICNNMLGRRKITLNEVAMTSTIGLIQRALDSGVNVTKVFVDTVGPPVKYQQHLTDTFDGKIKFQVEKKADALFPIVSAASICAKVTRDHALQVWQFREGLELTAADYGSGYPGDPATKSFIADNVDPVFGYPQLVRFSWATSQKVIDSKAFDVEWSDVEEENVSKSKKKKDSKLQAKNAKITSFFKRASTNDDTPVLTLPNFFIDRGLSTVETF